MAPRVGRNPKRRRPGTDANVMVLSSFIGFAVLVGSATAIINISVQDVQMAASDANAEDHSAYAALLLDRMLQAGNGWYAPDACVLNGGNGGPEDPEVFEATLAAEQGGGQGYAASGYGLDETQFQSEAVETFGLGVEPCGKQNTNGVNLLSWDKSNVLVPSGAGQAYQPSDMTYDEVRRSLGVSATGLDFRFTLDPILNPQPLKVAYVGHFDLIVTCTNILPATCDAITECIEDTSEADWATVCTAMIAGGIVGPTPTPTLPPGFASPAAPAAQDARPARSAQFAGPQRASFAYLGNCAIACVEYEWQAHESAYREYHFLQEVLSSFQPHISASGFESQKTTYQVGGDVYPDQGAELSTDFIGHTQDADGSTTAEYNVIVIGSRVDSDGMGLIAAELRDWVGVGGTLVLNGAPGVLKWMETDFGFQQASGQINSVKAGASNDPLVTGPNGFPWEGYPEPKRAYEATSGALADLRAPVLDGASANVALGVSHRKVYDDGFVVFSSYQPWNLREVGNPQGDACSVVDDHVDPEACDGLHLMENLMMAIYDSARLSLGPEPGASVDVASVGRVVGMLSPLDMWVDVRVRLEVFGALERAGGMDAPERCVQSTGSLGVLSVQTGSGETTETSSLFVKACKGAELRIAAPEGLVVGTYDIDRWFVDPNGYAHRPCTDIIGTDIQTNPPATCNISVSMSGAWQVVVRVTDTIGTGDYALEAVVG